MSLGGFAIAALAADNTVSDSNAGQGTSTVAGFTVTSIEYEADMETTESDPDIETVRFDIARDGDNAGTRPETDNAQVYVQLESENYVKCTLGADGDATNSTAVECDVNPTGGEVTYSEVDELNVVAYDTLEDAP